MAAATVIAFALYILDYQLGWIDCWAFEWGDFATLATGAIAAIGAGWIGMRQAAISARQTEILKHQVEIERITLRAELYDRRLQLLTDVRALFRHIKANAANVDQEGVKSLAPSLEATAFLFDDRIGKLAWKIYRCISAHQKGEMIENTDPVTLARDTFHEFLRLVRPYMKIEEFGRQHP